MVYKIARRSHIILAKRNGLRQNYISLTQTTLTVNSVKTNFIEVMYV